MRRLAVLMLLVAASAPGLAAGNQPHDPDAQIPAPRVQALPSLLIPEAAMAEEDWRTANETVGAFQRGHIDILRWEAENPPPMLGEPLPEGEPLSLSAAVRIALGNRPDLFATEDMNALARARADIAAVAFARDVQRAWIQAVASEQGLRRMEEAFEATAIAGELAVRMTRVGNWGQDRLLLAQLELSDAGIQLAQVRQQAMSARETLVRKLGLWGEGLDFALPEELPPLPAQPSSGEGLEARALRAHPALRLAAIEADRSQRGLNSRTWSMWTEAAEEALSRAVAVDSDNADPLAHPIKGAPVLERRRLPPGHEASKAASAAAEAAALAVTIRSQVREAHHQYQVAYDVARRASENNRFGENLQEETLLRYNGMLNSTWDLLASTRARVERSGAAVQALGDFWLAHANLQAVLAGAEYLGPDGGSVRTAGRANAGGH
jgi:hypothetical protein